VAEAAQQPPAAQALEEVEADALLLAVDADDEVDVVRELARLAAAAGALGEVEADLALGLGQLARTERLGQA
jgi:hypothetical protein